MIHRLNLDDDREAWNRAIERAIANRCEHVTSHVCSAKVQGFESTWDVRSSSTQGKVYFVQLLVKDGKREAICDCPAGQTGRICWHMAGAALIAGMLTQPAPVEAMKKLDSDDAPKMRTEDFSIGDILSGRYAEALAAGQLG